MIQQIRGQRGHLVFPIDPKKHKIGRGCRVLASYKVSLNSVWWFQRTSRKCEKLTPERRTEDGQRVITSAQVN